MRCAELMEREVVCCRPSDAVTAVAQTMRDHGIGFVPVCVGRRVVGVVTDRDLVVRAVAAGRPCDRVPVEDVMTREVVTCRGNDDLAEVERLMAHHQKYRIVCTDAERQLLGVVSLIDVATVERGEHAANVLRALAARDACFVML